MKNKDDAGKGTFILRCDFYPQVQLLTREQRGDLLTAIFAYAATGEIIELDGITNMCFEFIKTSIDFYATKYDAQCQINRENGKKGGRPKKHNDENQTDNIKTGRFNENQPESEKTDRIQRKATGKNITERIISEPNGIDKTDRFSEKPNKSEKTEISPFPPITPLSPVSVNVITHTVVTEWKGGVGENQTAEFLDWLDSAYPEIAAMAEPITEEQARDILAKFSAEDINRIIAAMDNKGAYRNKSAYSTFASFVAHDIIIKSRKADTGRKYTYNEVIAEVDGGRGAWDDFQFLAMPDGTKYWMRKIDIAAIQA